MTEALLIDRQGAVDYVTLNRPDKLNALSPDMIDALLSYFESLYRQRDTRIVVLKANGRGFCAGLDMTPGVEYGEDYGRQGAKRSYVIQQRISDIYRAMRKSPQPIISLIHGAACGGGFSLALASDIRIAADNVKMNAAYIKIGLTGCDMGSSYFLPRLVGASKAAELILTGRFIYAEEALASNLVSQIVPVDQLLEAAKPIIEAMLATTPMGLRLSKQALNMAIDAPSLESALATEDRHQALLTLTEDHLEAVNAFQEKRVPVYKDQ